MRQKFFITILLLLSVVAPFAALADSFKVNTVNLEPGKTGALRFSLDNTQEFYGFQAEIKLPAGLEAVKAADGKKLAVTLTDRAADGKFQVNSNILPNGNLIIGAFSTNNNPFTGNSGDLAELQVSVADDFAGGLVELSEVYFINSEDQDVEFTSTSTQIGVAVTGITLSETSCVLKVGDTATLTATLTPASLPNKKVTWTSSNTAVAKVDASGNVTAVTAGTAVITATSAADANFKATCNVTVKKAVESVSIDKTETTLKVGAAVSLKATINPAGAIVSTVTWSSSDPNVATVENGKVTAVAVGEAVITATAGDKSAACKVTVKNAVSGVTLDKTEATVNKGDVFQLTATVSPADAIATTVAWKSSNTKVATVDETGLVTAVDGGSAVITVTSTDDTNIKATCTVTVNVPVEGLEVQDEDLKPLESGVVINVNTGDSYDLTAVVKPANATDNKVTWTSSDEAVATVDSNGLIDTHKAGEATITASIAGFSFTAKVVVKDAEIVVTGVTLDQTKAEMKTGKTLQLNATVTPEEAASKTVTWSSSDKEIATVSKGLVTALKAGKVTITATANKIKATCEITITDIDVTAVTLDITEIEALMEGESVKLTATVTPDDATDKSVAWTSSDESVAMVDEEGNVTAVAPGKATVTATAGSVSANCVITVTAKPVAVESIELSESEIVIEKGTEFAIECTVHPEDATDKTVVWSSSDETIAAVDAAGRVTALNGGSAVITAKVADKTATCKVIVTVPVTSLVVLDEDEKPLSDGAVVEFNTGHEYNLTAVVGPEDATDKTVAWTTSDETVVSFLDDEGLMNGLKAGEAKVTASIAGFSVTVMVKVTDPVIPVTGVTLNKTTADMLTGETLQLEAKIEPEDATSKDLTWTSSDKTIATVSTKGLVKALKAGKVTITVSSNQKTATCEITITDPIVEVDEVTLDKTEVSLTEGETITLTATITPENATDKTVAWTSSDESVATVSAAGEVTALKAGSATITAASANGKTASCIVTVKAKIIDATAITLSATAAELKVGETISLTATVAPENTTDKTVVWISSDENIAIVDVNGKVTALALGVAEITATCGNVSAICRVTVVPTPIESITLSETELNLTEGDTATLIATVAPEDATDKTVIWTSSDESVATVSATGEVTAVKAGTATITGTSSNGKTATCKVTVEPAYIEVVEITLDKTEAKVNEGETLQLVATVTPDDATDATVTWTSSDESVATVDENGLVTAIAWGNVVITAQAGDKTAECAVTVDRATAVELLGLDPDSDVKVFDLNGLLVADTVDGLQRGTYIICQGNQTKKIIVK